MEKRKNNIAKREKMLIIIFSVAITFSICIFNQFDVLFRNQIEFGIQPQEIILGFVLFSLIVFSLVLSVLFLTAHFCKTAFKVVLAVMLGFMLAGYVQVLLLNGHYNGAFEDFAGAYKPISGWIKFSNIFIWLVVCLLPLALLLIEKITKKNFFKKAVLLAAAVVFVMQAVGFGTAAPNADFRRYDKSFYFSIDQQLVLSKAKPESEPQAQNIVVFILDRGAAGYTDEVFKTYPDAKDNFEGFTYYRDNISEYGQTFPSVISMLTGEGFEETESRSSFSKRAWSKATLFDELHERDYTVNGLLDELSVYYDIEEIADKFDNIRYVDEERKVSQWDAVRSMTKLSLQRTLPYVLKNAAGFDYPNDLNRIVNNRMADFFPNNVGANSDKRFAQKLDSLGLSATNEQNTFSFVHLDCSHQNDWRQSTYDTFNVLGNYFEQMKTLGIFEKSTIILTADHSAGGQDRNSTLMIKRNHEDKQDNYEPMKTDTASKLSNGFFLSTIFELIGAADKKTTVSYFDIIDNVDITDSGLDSDRYYYDVSWDVGNHCTFSGKRKIED